MPLRWGFQPAESATPEPSFNPLLILLFNRNYCIINRKAQKETEAIMHA